MVSFALFLYHLIEVYEYIILARCILSFLPIGDGVIVSFVFTVTEFVLAPFRALLNKTPIGPDNLMLDLSPIFAIILLDVLLAVMRG